MRNIPQENKSSYTLTVITNEHQQDKETIQRKLVPSPGRACDL